MLVAIHIQASCSLALVVSLQPVALVAGSTFALRLTHPPGPALRYSWVCPLTAADLHARRTPLTCSSRRQLRCLRLVSRIAASTVYNGPRNLDNDLPRDRVNYQYENDLQFRFQGSGRTRVAQGGKTISQLAAEYKVHPNVLRDWRTLAVKNLATLFDKHDDVASLRTAHEQQLEDLYA
jgi:hypothetical protein